MDKQGALNRAVAYIVTGVVSFPGAMLSIALAAHYLGYEFILLFHCGRITGEIRGIKIPGRNSTAV